MEKRNLGDGYRGNGNSLKRELQLRRDAVYGTVDWIEDRVSTDVLDKVLVAIDNAFKYGILYNIGEGMMFRSGLEDEL